MNLQCTRTMRRYSFFVLSIRYNFRRKSSFFKHKKKLSVTNSFVTISENRVYCNNKPTNYQIWSMLVYIRTIVFVHPSRKQEEKNAFCQIVLSSFPRFIKMQCNSIVIEKIEYYPFALIIFIVDQSVCCGLLWYDLLRKVRWLLLRRWTRKIMLLVKWLIL